MPVLAMETQANMETAHQEIQEERNKDPAEEINEREFLKDLYVFMKKRDTPIERIPNLGFKQIDLYVMYKTVREIGGYHQVTAQQMWKQVYNMLGGNPRSTSAATCTRRHYEKLLLPYECHRRGIPISLLPQHQPKTFPFASFCKDESDGPRPAKRRLASMPLQQSTHNIQSDPHGRVFSLPLHYPPYYRPSHTVQPPHVPMSSPVLTQHTPPAPQPWFAFNPTCPIPTERAKEPLELLRSLAEQYKTTSGLAEPLNLSVKAPRKETNSNPVSSFAPPSSNKSPKFLNKPSTLYAPQSPQVRNEGSDASQDGEAGVEEEKYSYPSKEREAHVVDVKPIRASSSPRYVQTPIRGEDAATLAPKPSSQKTDFEIKEEAERNLDVRGLNLNQILPTLARENGGKMEIEIPLSLFHNWLRLCGSTATMQGHKQLSTLPSPEDQGHSSDTDLPKNLTIHKQHQSPVPEDLRLRKRHLPSPPAPTIKTTSPPLITGQIPFTSYRHLPPGGILEHAASQDTFPFDQQNFQKPYISKSPNCWDVFERDAHAAPVNMKTDSHNSLAVQQHFAGSNSYDDDDVVLVEKEKPEMPPSAFVMLGSGSHPLLQLTPEEVRKLKKIISSS
ncbi:AT-rich interaction domain 6 [Labrus bergylta]|uniref:AT-rich interaction domain 6 n=1 Tax=Labrus bergylta TaxID=56723 RepID=UPI00331336EB